MRLTRASDDANPDKEQVNKTVAELKWLEKQYEFHRYDEAGHAFFIWGGSHTARSRQRTAGGRSPDSMGVAWWR